MAEADPPEVTPKLKSSPEPESATVCGLPDALSLIERVPVLVPPAMGLKVTLKVQFAPAAKEPPQSFVAEKSPLTPTVIIVKEDCPEFVSVTVWAELAIPTNWPPNDKDVGETTVLTPNSPNAPTPFVVPT